MKHKDPETTSCSNFSEIVETPAVQINNDCFDDNNDWGWPSREATPAFKNHERTPSPELNFASASTRGMIKVPHVEKDLNLLGNGQESTCSFEAYVQKRSNMELPRSSPITVGER